MPVSMVIPAYNAAATIADTLNSILAQTCPEWEAIVVDDGSTDATCKVVKGFIGRDPRIRILRQPNGGESSARNTGISKARYDWLLFLDADDWISPVYLERMTNKLISDSTLDAVHCGYARVAADGTLVVDNYQPPSGDMFSTLARRAAFPVHACIVRKSLVEDVGQFDASLRTCPDWDLWQRIARTGARFGAVGEVLAFYRMRPGGASLDAYQLFKDDLRVLKQGHSPDPRVRNAHPDHETGEPPEQIKTQEFYLLSWCAGLLLGSAKDARPLLEMVKDDNYPYLSPDAVAQCIFEAAPLPTCQPPQAWEKLWPAMQHRIEDFFVALERQSRTPDLARRALSSFKRMVLKSSPTWNVIVEGFGEITAPLEEERRNWQRLAQEREQGIEEQKGIVEQLSQSNVLLEEERTNWQRVAEERERSVEEQKVLVEHLTQSKALLERERTNWQRVAEERERSVEEQKVLVERLTQSKALLERERSNWQRIAEEREQIIGEQKGLVDELRQSKALLEQERETWQRLAEERERAIEEQKTCIGELEQARAVLEERKSRLEEERGELQEQVRQRTAERDDLRRSYEQRLGDLVLNRLALRAPLLALEQFWAAVRQRLSVARLAAESLLLRARGKHRRVMATVCDTFPIYSQTFVYQELTQLVRRGFDLRLSYSKLDSCDYLSPQFRYLWRVKRRLFLNQQVHEKDFARYQARLPEKVESLIEKLCECSGMARHDLIHHGNFLQAFSFTCMVEAYRPEYLHSYFFYDRSLMALVAGYLLDIPRGVTCYADHLLKDYELKVVPLHLELCDIIIATSERIKQELLAIAPNTDPRCILVKPNGIDTECFPRVERVDPAEGAPFRLVSVCRIEPKKGLLDLVEAVSLLRQRGLNVEAHLVGTVDEWSEASRDYKRRLDQRITELNLWGTVHLEGRQDLNGVLRFLRNAHLFVAPFVETDAGDKDGIPTAVLEGMATGLAVVATDAGSITEIIENGREGLIVPQRAPEALAGAIRDLIHDRSRRLALGVNAAQKVRDRFDVSSCEMTFHDRLFSLLAMEGAKSMSVSRRLKVEI